MSRCVPSLKFDEIPSQPSLDLSSNSLAPHVPMLNYEVAELTWKNGQLGMNSLGPLRLAAKQSPSWEKPRVGGTLESIVNQATSGLPHCTPTTCGDGPIDDLVPWINHAKHQPIVAAAASATMSMDAMVPSSNATAREQQSSHMLERVQMRGPCSGNNTTDTNRNDVATKSARMACGPVVPSQQEWHAMGNNSFSGSATFGKDNRQLTLDSCERELGVGGFTSTSTGSPENTSSGHRGTKATTTDEHESVCHREYKREKEEEGKKKAGGKSTVTGRRSRAAAIHNQSERKRRDKINQRMNALQKLVPNSSKTDKASMLDEVIEYLKQLQAQVNMMNRNMSSMMLPLTLQQQLQLSMMAGASPMGMGMGLGGVMDLNSISRPNLAGISPMLQPAAFMPFTSWDSSADRLAGPTAMVLDSMSAFLACQSQPMTMDAYSRMAALYQQFNQASHPPASKK